jgi:hypothetical protein
LRLSETRTHTCAYAGDVRNDSSLGCGPSIAMSSTTRPGRAAMTTTRVDRYTASQTLWVTKTTVRPSSLHRRSTSSLSFARVISSSAANGSSISSRRGLVTIARAIEARIFMPPESSRG